MPPATGSPSATAAETAAATEADAAGGAGITFSPRRNSHDARGSSNIPSPLENSSHSDSNRASFWHARTRSARSCSTVSYAGSDVPLNQSFRHMSHQRRPSVVQYQSISRPLALTPPQQSPTSILQLQLPVPPLPMSARPNPDNSDSVNINRCSSHSMFDEYLQQEKQPRDVSSLSTLAASASSSVLPHMFSSGAAAGASDDSDGPLLDGLSPPRLSVSGSRHIVYERRSSSLHHLATIGRAIG
ncbi:hypothetical protein SPBR_05285 [Sporothrix brasiliensis 5110]|uniref:Uncharacterized protein n=1 Tax=Sporothrix brasiliensis 5110 TaxID=1398154 RepID=A0A0C2ID43_9PEZI|nr:uncharacterized protein SPBR_05285 [Sporothrix brasiliensis 5110]KIH87181.1 hypothetical protein SPBR_05285 [Sporothrix brasiliensis 5110]